MLKRPALLLGMLLTTVAVSMFVASGIANSQSKSKTSKKDEAKKSDDEEIKGRLPRYYGQLDLKDEQVADIYKVQAEYNEQIQELEDKLAALKEKLDSECEKVLTAAQRKTLASLRDDSGDKEEPKSKSTTKKKSDSKKSESKKKESDKKESEEK